MIHILDGGTCKSRKLPNPEIACQQWQMDPQRTDEENQSSPFCQMRHPLEREDEHACRRRIDASYPEEDQQDEINLDLETKQVFEGKGERVENRPKSK